MTRSRRAGLSRDEVRRQPLYARLLGLQYLAPSGFLCFVFLEGAIALGILLALAELVSWWGVLVLPVTVAVMVKLNDVVAGALMRPRPAAPGPGDGRAAGRPARRGARGPVAGVPPRRDGDFPEGFGFEPRAGGFGSPGAETVRLSPSGIGRAGDAPPLRPAALPVGEDGARRSHDGARSPWHGGPGGPLPGGTEEPFPAREEFPGGETRRLPRVGGDGWPAGDETHRPGGPAGDPFAAASGDGGAALGLGDAGLVNGPRTAQQWADGLDEQQRARQSAARRYE
ncbi:hypothetical protein CLV70_114144 [Pseudosporangium ferrugineum]|uniref:Uncharacterized protein n=1 Tax=Pseudosporangium ferrugineum TaxID=439699 RepID=A0A2T0RS80_9ACTN|nr:hypothetical protein CLV70_114144 [Pseudosporangium ferrugineum]